MESPSVVSFVGRMLSLLDLEREAELDETRLLQESCSEAELERRGVCIRKVCLGSIVTGLGGRTLIKLHKDEYRSKEAELPANRFGTGDTAVLVKAGSLHGTHVEGRRGRIEEAAAHGIVYRTTRGSITLAFDELPEELIETTASLSLHLVANEVTHRRLREIGLQLEAAQGMASALCNVLFNGVKPEFSVDASPVIPINPKLNHLQVEAVAFALSAKQLALIHGPPGTGKTTTVVEAILQLVQRGQTCLVCAPSNVAVDNIVEKLSHQNVKLVRMGHPARVQLPHVLKHCLDIRIKNDEGTAIVADVRREMDKLFKDLKQTRNKSDRRNIFSELKHLRKELKQREKQIVHQIIKQSNVVLATNIGAADRLLKGVEFDVVIIDEAAQALEASCWIPMLKGKKLILAGDHLQLPPTIKSQKAEKDGLGVTLFDRVMKLFGQRVSKMLTIQYRMHEKIMKWPSIELYENKLIADVSVKSHLITDLPHISSTEQLPPAVLIDTAGCSLEEEKELEGDSRANEGEAQIVIAYVVQLIQMGLDPSEIALISPYNAQVHLLREALSKRYPTLEIGSVDGFQGREKEAVIISLVRSNVKREVGFLSENRRTNVAITRARRHLAIICDSETVGSNQFLSRMVDYFQEFAEIQSASEYMTDISSVPRLLLPAALSKPTQSKRRSKLQEVKEPLKPKSQIQKARSPLAESRDRDNREELQNQLIDFQKDHSRQEMLFASTLSSYDRMLVHDIAESLHLQHASQGEGTNRYIIVTKKKTDSIVLSPKNEEVSQPQELIVQSSKESRDTQKEGENKSTTVEPSISQNKKSKKHPQPLKKEVPFTKGGKANSTLEKEEDIMVVIEAAIEQNKRCNFQGCKISVQTMGRLCAFCGFKYCISHSLPEIHANACAVEAKKKARAEWLASEGGAKTKKPLKAADRQQLQNKLKQKIGKSLGPRQRDTKK